MSDTDNLDKIVDAEINFDEGVITSAYGPEEAEEDIDKQIGKSPLDDD